MNLSIKIIKIRNKKIEINRKVIITYFYDRNVKNSDKKSKENQ